MQDIPHTSDWVMPTPLNRQWQARWRPHLMSSARFSRRVFQKHLGTLGGSMFLKTQGMSGRDRASGHAVYNYTNQNDTFAKYDAFRERRLILVTLSESKWRSMKLELEAAS